MKAKIFAFNAVYNVVFSIVLASVSTLAAATVGQLPITPEGFLVDFLIGFAIAWVVGMVFPIQKMGEAFSKSVGATSPLAVSLLSALLCGTFFFVVINFATTAIHTGFATFVVDDVPVTFMNRFMDGFLMKWIYVIPTVVMTMPLSFMVAHKITGFPPAEAHADTAGAAQA